MGCSTPQRGRPFRRAGLPGLRVLASPVRAAPACATLVRMYPDLGDVVGVDLPIPTHEVFVALGVLVAVGAFVVEARRRGQTDERLSDVVAGRPGRRCPVHAARHLAAAPRPARQRVARWSSGSTATASSSAAWSAPSWGSHVAKRLVGYRARTGDLFAPAVALGMAVGRVGCLLTELPGTPTGTAVGHHPRPRVRAATRMPPPARRCTPRSRTRSPSSSPRSPRSGSGCGTASPHRGRRSSSTSSRTGCSGSSSSSCGATRSCWRASPGRSCSSLVASRSSWRASSTERAGAVPRHPLPRRGRSRARHRRRHPPPRPRQGPTRPQREGGHAAARRPHPPVRQRLLPALPRRGPAAAAGGGAPAVGLARRARRPGLARARVPRPRPGPHALRRVAGDPALPRGVDRADQGARARRARQLPARAVGLRCTGCPRCRPSTPASCSRTSPTTATCAAPRASPTPRPRWARWRRWSSVLASIDTRLSRENGRIDVLMLSGGEPTLYPQLAELLDEVAARPIVRVLVNTNGVRIARDDALLDLLTQPPRAGRGVPAVRRTVGRDASRHHRGADLRRLKDRAVDRLSQRGIFTTLTMTVALGVNDDEIGAVVKRALDTPVRRAGSASSRSSGRAGPGASTRSTGSPTPACSPGSGRRPAEQVTWRDLTALPCSHPHCCSVGYLLRDDGGQWRSLTSLIGHERLQGVPRPRSRMPSPTGSPTTSSPPGCASVVKDSLLGLLSEQSSLSHPRRRPALEGRLRELRPRHLGRCVTLAASALPGRRLGCAGCSASGCCG